MSAGSRSKARAWRLGAVVGGVSSAVLLAELVLRLSWPALPSVSAAQGVDDPLVQDFVKRGMAGPHLPTCDQAPPKVNPGGPREVGEGSGPPLRLLVAGDSVARGWGVGDDDGWAVRLASSLADEERPVVLRWAGHPGHGLCTWASHAHGSLSRGNAPDLAVLQVFADDIAVRGMIMVNGEVVAQPGFGSHPLVNLATRVSFVANRLWFAWATHRGPVFPERLDTLHGRQVFVRTLGRLGARLDEAGVAWTIVLVGPAGQHLCGQDPRVESDCSWLMADLDRMARWLDDAELPWIDLREVWADTPSDLLDRELGDLEVRGRLPVHPGPEGHAALAGAILPWARTQAEGRP